MRSACNILNSGTFACESFGCTCNIARTFIVIVGRVRILDLGSRRLVFLVASIHHLIAGLNALFALTKG